MAAHGRRRAVDEDGYLVLVDRSKDMIIRGGENIYPREIEAVVHGLPRSPRVVGRAHPVYGEEPVLFVAASRETLIPTRSASTSGSLSKYKLPVESRSGDSS